MPGATWNRHGQSQILDGTSTVIVKGRTERPRACCHKNADEPKTQAIFMLPSEASPHQPHHCSTRDQRWLNLVTSLLNQGHGHLSRVMSRIIDYGQYQYGSGAELVSPPVPVVMPPRGRKFQLRNCLPGGNRQCQTGISPHPLRCIRCPLNVTLRLNHGHPAASTYLSYSPCGICDSPRKWMLK